MCGTTVSLSTPEGRELNINVTRAHNWNNNEFIGAGLPTILPVKGNIF